MLSFIRVPRLLKHNVSNHIIGCLIYAKSYFNLDKFHFKINLNARRALAALSVILVCFTSLFSLSASASSNWKPGQILVSPKPGLSKVEFDKVLGKYKGKSKSKISKLNVHIVSVPEKAEKGIINALSKNPNIEFAELDELVAPTEIHANDNHYSIAWHLAKMNLPTAWEQSKGAGVVVAVLDTGVNVNHTDLAANMLPGWNTASNNTDISDNHGHGTMTSGVIGAVSNNSVGVTSIAWDVDLLPIKISERSDGVAAWSDIAEAIIWAADNGADIASISYQIFPSSTAIDAAQYFYNKGGLVVSSAGNGGVELNCSDNKYLMTVGATDQSDVKASFSGYGNCIDVVAPGVSLPTTTKDGGYAYFNGTSAATPATAAVLALIKSKYPNKSNLELESILESTADKTVSGANFTKQYGHGRIDALAALSSNIPAPDEDQITPTVTITSPSEDSTASGFLQVNVDAFDNVAVNQVDLYVDGALFSTDTTKPYSFSIDTTNISNGQVALQAHANDAVNNIGSSGNHWIVIDNNKVTPEPTPEPTPEDTIAPTVSIINPTNGSRFSNNQNIRVNAQDNVGVVKVELRINGQLKVQTTTYSLEYSWNVKKSGTGNHQISAKAFDAAGNSKEQIFNVTVTKKGNGK